MQGLQAVPFAPVKAVIETSPSMTTSQGKALSKKQSHRKKKRNNRWLCSWPCLTA